MKNYKVEAWPWCADYCKKNQWNPHDSYFWDKAMLEYRRQHNIFEVGDKVVAPILNESFVGKIISYRSDIDKFDVMGSRHWGWFFAHQLKHLTDAEIAAGRRL